MNSIPQVKTEAEAQTVWEACREILHVDYWYWNLMAFLFEGDLADKLNSTFINEWEAFSENQQARIRAICGKEEKT